jgi:hypothetical protein
MAKKFGAKKPVTMGGAMPIGPPEQRGGKMKPGGLLKKASKVAEKVPTGPMKGVKY